MAKILIIDDDVEYVETMSLFLKTRGFDILSADCGEEGYQIARISLPDMILLDVMMKTDNEGLEIARRLGDDPATKKIPILMITGIRTALSLPGGLTPDSGWLPVRAILEKPVRPEILLHKIQEHINPQN
jgi:CheY-like chemotaxis protein